MVDFLKKQGYLFICLGLLALLVIALFWALSIGTVKLPLVNIYNTVVEQLFSGQPSKALTADRCMILSGCCACRVWCWLP